MKNYKFNKTQMKKRFILKETGEELKLGDVIRSTVNLKRDNIWTKITVKDLLVDEKLLADLVNDGFVIEEATEDNIPMDIDFYMDTVITKLNWSITTTSALDDIVLLYGNAFSLMIIKEISCKMYNNTEYGPNDDDVIYLISPDTGRYYKASGRSLKNNPYAAIFYNLEDVKKACRIIKPLFERES